MTNEELINILKKRVDKKSPVFVGKFPINALSLSEKEYSQTIVDIRRGNVEGTEEEPIKVVYSVDTEQFNVMEGYIKIVNFQRNKRQYIPANIWSTPEPIVNVFPNDLLFDPIPLLNFHSLKETISKKGLKKIIKEIISQILNKEIRLEPPVDVTVKETTSEKELQVKRVLSKWNDNNIIVTVVRYDELPNASYVQVDGIINGQNIFSSNPEDLNKWGLQIPSSKELLTLPKGQYKLSDVKRLLKKVSVNETMTYEKLLSLTTKTPRNPEDDTNRIDRSKTVNVRSIPVSVEKGLEQWNFRYKSTPQDTVTDKPFEGHITFLKGEVGRNDDAMKLECKVDCGCPDYMYKFAYNNYTKGAGDIGGNSLNKCANRSPKASYDIGEGLCKHLVSLGRYLKTKIASTRKSNLFEAVGDVANQGPFNITYYDD